MSTLRERSAMTRSSGLGCMLLSLEKGGRWRRWWWRSGVARCIGRCLPAAVALWWWWGGVVDASVVRVREDSQLQTSGFIGTVTVSTSLSAV